LAFLAAVAARISRRSVSACGPGLMARSATLMRSSVTGLSAESQTDAPSSFSSARWMTYPGAPFQRSVTASFEA